MSCISGQVLPFNPDNPEEEFLYGYDAFFCDFAAHDDKPEIKRLEKRTIGDKNYYPDIVPFDESKHISGNEKSGGNTSMSKETRKQQKENR